MTPIGTIHRHLAIDFLRSVGRGLDGFAEAHALWRDDPGLRELAAEAAALRQMWLETYRGKVFPFPESDPQAAVEIQLINAAVRWVKTDPATWIRFLIDHDPRDFSVTGKQERRELTEAERAWNTAGMVIGNPRVRDLMNCWRAATPGFLEALAHGLPDVELPTVAAMGEVEGIAQIAVIWRNVWKDQPARDDPAVSETLQAYSSLSDQEADGLADMLLDQQESWTAVNLHKTDRFWYFVGSHLAELAAFHGPLSAPRRARAEALEADSPPAVKLAPGEDLSCKQAEVELGTEQATRYLPTGFALKKLADGSPIPTPVAAGLLGLHPVGDGNPLLVVLDIDLTHPAMAFLGLQGTRLRICSGGTPVSDEPIFTQVTLDGGVKPLELSDEYPEPKIDDFGLARFCMGRALLSPYEGLHAAGSLGARDKIGGAPDWQQWPDDPVSPKSGEFMTFIAQFDHPLGGTAYAFLDFENLIATVITQHD